MRAYVDRVEIACADRIVASHRRCYQRGRDVMDPYHYLSALLRKPRGFRQALAFLGERPDYIGAGASRSSCGFSYLRTKWGRNG